MCLQAPTLCRLLVMLLIPSWDVVAHVNNSLHAKLDYLPRPKSLLLAISPTLHAAPSALQAAPDAVYQGTLETFESLGRVVESLQSRTTKLTAGA